MLGALLMADGSAAAGYGHLSRSASLARALQVHDVTTTCMALGPKEERERYGVTWLPESGGLTAQMDILVLDTYGPEPAWLAEHRMQRLVVRISDAPHPPAADLVVDPAAPSSIAPGHLAGMKHALLGPPFWGASDRTVATAVGRVLVTVGRSTETTGGMAIAEEVRRALPATTEVVLVGAPSGPADTAPRGVKVLTTQPTLLNELLAADIVVCGAGQTMLEALAVGSPCVGMLLADNQRRAVEALEGKGAVVVATPESVGAACAALLPEPARAALSATAQRCVDGVGALRVAFSIVRAAAGRQYQV